MHCQACAPNAAAQGASRLGVGYVVVVVVNALEAAQARKTASRVALTAIGEEANVVEQIEIKQVKRPTEDGWGVKVALGDGTEGYRSGLVFYGE